MQRTVRLGSRLAIELAKVGRYLDDLGRRRRVDEALRLCEFPGVDDDRHGRVGRFLLCGEVRRHGVEKLIASTITNRARSRRIG